MYKIPAITLFLGKNLKYVPECQSTNDLMQLICQQEQLSEGTVVVTSNQYQGRGQRGNSWESEPGRNITLSLLLRPAFLPVQKQFFLNIFVSLGISDFLTANTTSKVHIKWPNDILLGEKKVCGVLIENQIVGQALSTSIVGIGLNVNQQQFSIPTATSIFQAMETELELQSAFEGLLHSLETRYLQLRQGKFEQLKNQYLDKLFKKDLRHSFVSTQTGPFEGTITGIDDIGRLMIKSDEGERSYDIKEIKFMGW